MNAVLASLAAVGGLLAGGVIDPVGQRMARRSQIEEAERKREREERKRRDREDGDRPEPDEGDGERPEPDEGDGERPEPDEGDGERPGTDLPEDTDVPQDPGAGVEPPTSGPAVSESPELRHLVPAGRSIPRTFVASVLTGALWTGAAARFGGHVVLGAYLSFFALLVAVALTDLSTRLVPRRLLYPCAGIAAAFFVASAPVDHTASHLSGAAIGGAIAFAAFFVVWWFVPHGMGFGDVRLAGVIGIAVGWLSLLQAYVAFFVGFVTGLIFGVIAIALAGGGRRARIPFAPALAVGAVIGVFWGGPIVRAVFGVGA